MGKRRVPGKKGMTQVEQEAVLTDTSYEAQLHTIDNEESLLLEKYGAINEQGVYGAPVEER